MASIAYVSACCCSQFLSRLISLGRWFSAAGQIFSGSATAQESPATVEPAVEAPATESLSSELSSELKHAEEVTEAEVKNWMTSIDSYFGVMVKWLAAIIFFDFFTGKFLPAPIPFVVAWLFLGALFLTIRMRFINIRGFRHAIDVTRGAFDKPGDQGDVSHFQALAAALSATVGLGNIAGVAIAIGTGGPGATFWIIVVGLLGMTSKFAECTLGLKYRKVDENGMVLGGPMRYLHIGLGEMGFPTIGKLLAVVFMVLCIGQVLGAAIRFKSPVARCDS